jgi:hypothetical protein
MIPPASKQRRAYCRKLCVAHLIARAPHDLHDADVREIGIVCAFVQQGPKHRHGHYAIRDWGDHDPRWIAEHFDGLLAALRAQ